MKIDPLKMSFRLKMGISIAMLVYKKVIYLDDFVWMGFFVGWLSLIV